MTGMRRIRILLTTAALVVATALPAALTSAAAASAPTPSPPPQFLGGPVSFAGIDLENSTVLDLQKDFNTHRLSSTALTAFYLTRIRLLNPTLHAVIQTNPDALREAVLSDIHRFRQGSRGPLDGIPVLLKDNIGFGRTTAGSEALLQARPAEAFLAQRLQAAGAIILGKANLSEWANFRSTTSSSGWSGVGGLTANPYVLDHNACGSSSGSGVGASANLASVTIGTETDGSIVCPSGVDGDVGIKPTLGEVSRSGVVPLSAMQDTAGPITRNVTDAAAVLSVIGAPDPADPATAGTKVQDFTKVLDANALRGKRIGVWLDPNAQGDPGAPTLAVFNNAVSSLTALGATPVPVTLPFQDVIGADELPALENEFKHDINAYLAATPGPHPADLAGLIAFNQAHAATEMPFFGQEIFTASQRSIDETMASQHLDAIVAPDNAPAWLTNLQTGDTVSFGSSSPAAVAGYASVAVPMGFVGPLPVGLSFIGGRYAEPQLVAMAYAFEQGTHARKAPTFLPHL
jgi:amidase